MSRAELYIPALQYWQRTNIPYISINQSTFDSHIVLVSDLSKMGHMGHRLSLSHNENFIFCYCVMKINHSVVITDCVKLYNDHKSVIK